MGSPHEIESNVASLDQITESIWALDKAWRIKGNGIEENSPVTVHHRNSFFFNCFLVYNYYDEVKHLQIKINPDCILHAMASRESSVKRWSRFSFSPQPTCQRWSNIHPKGRRDVSTSPRNIKCMSELHGRTRVTGVHLQEGTEPRKIPRISVECEECTCLGMVWCLVCVRVRLCVCHRLPVWLSICVSVCVMRMRVFVGGGGRRRGATVVTVPALIDSAGGARVANVTARQRHRGRTQAGNLWQDPETAESGRTAFQRKIIINS